MLLKHSPASIETLRTRATAEFLPNLVTSRSSNSGLRNFKDRIPLPGLGAEYWRNTRAHLFCGAMPSKFSKALIKPAHSVEAVHIKDYLEKLFPFWSIQAGSPKSKVSWEEAELEVEEKMFPLLRLPVKPFEQGRYQNGTKLRRGNVTVFHGTRESTVVSILTTGIHPSPCSHGAIGIWVNYSLPEALNWTPTVVDLAPHTCS